MLGGYRKRGQTIIQTWHASGALKLFGLQDHQVDTANTQMVTQYKKFTMRQIIILLVEKKWGSALKVRLMRRQQQMLNLGYLV